MKRLLAAISVLGLLLLAGAPAVRADVPISDCVRNCGGLRYGCASEDRDPYCVRFGDNDNAACKNLVYECDGAAYIFTHKEYWIGLAITVVVELIVIMFILRRRLTTLQALIITAVNLLTYTIFTLVLVWKSQTLGTSAFTVAEVIGEVIIVLAEAQLYAKLLKFGFKKSFLLSLAANVASVLTGLSIYALT